MISLDEVESVLKDGSTLETEHARKLIQENARDGELFRRAAMDGYINVVKFFISAKNRCVLTYREANRCTNRGAANPSLMTPLHIASYFGFIDIVDCLAKSESFQRYKSLWKVTPLSLACRQGHLDVVKLLISYNIFSERQCIDAMNIAALKGLLDVVVYLFSVGVSPVEAMCYAAVEGREDIVSFFLVNGVCPDAKTEVDCIFIDACGLYLFNDEEHFKEVFFVSYCQPDRNKLLSDILCKYSVCSNELGDQKNATPLHLATQCGHFSVVHQFLESKACVNMTNLVGCTPLDIAVNRGHKNMALLLQLYGGVLNKKGSFLKKAIKRNCFLTLQCLQVMGTDLNWFEKIRRRVGRNKMPSPLHIACSNNRENIVRYLLQHNVLVDARDNEGNTSLHCACSEGHNEIAQLLVEHGASVSSRNNQGESPLTLAVMKKRTTLVEYLLENNSLP